MYDKQKSFGEKDENKEIEFQYSKLNSNLNGYLSLSLKKESFRDKDHILTFCLDIVDLQKTHLPEDYIDIQQEEGWINIELDLDSENKKYSDSYISNVKRFLDEVNYSIKKANEDSIDNLIHEFFAGNQELYSDDEIKNDIKENYERILNSKESEVDGTEDPYIKSVLGWATIRANQSNLIEYIINDDLTKISEEHYKYLSKEVKDALNGWVKENKNYSGKKRSNFKARLCKVIRRNLDDLIESQEEIARTIYLDKK